MFKHKVLTSCLTRNLVCWSRIVHQLNFAGKEEDYIRALEDGQFQCDLCQFRCARKDSTRRHIRLKHFPENETWQCQFCNRFYKNKISLGVHQRREHNIYKNSS